MKLHETTESIYLFIRSYMLSSDGRPPTIRDSGDDRRTGLRYQAGGLSVQSGN